ncbi:hypothetical protein EDB85DRAFT_2238837 [Lactarius pseudohatsudake]|nr:hypothetical protein EDB85DRAFT_2238837 [Lactarius pseudohatsudake]
MVVEEQFDDARFVTPGLGSNTQPSLPHPPTLPLPLVIYLVFCLKQAKDDWGLPDFHICPDLSIASDGVSSGLCICSDDVVDTIGPNSGNQSCIGHPLPRHLPTSRALSPPPRPHIQAIFDSSSRDEDALEHILVAAVHFDITTKTLLQLISLNLRLSGSPG